MSEQLPRRFCVFAGYDFYPAGGWHDFRLSRDTLEEAMQAAEDLRNQEPGEVVWWQIFDATQRRVVAQSQYQGFGAESVFPDLNK